MLLVKEQEDYDAARFQELTTRVRELEVEARVLRSWKTRAQRLFRSQST